MSTHQAEIGALLNRLTLGTMFVSHALLKIFVFTLPGTVGFFASVGLPGWSAYPVIAAELFGGVALLLGYRTRLVAAALIPVLLGALVVHWGNGWVFSAPNGGWEYPAFLAMSAFVQVFLGDGYYALRRSERSDRSVTAAA